MEPIPWRLVATDLPGWVDVGAAELRRGDGTIVRGYLSVEELWTGEDEIPLAVFVADSGEQLSIFDFEAWRIVKRAQNFI
jgi:hypothetical protein